MELGVQWGVRIGRLEVRYAVGSEGRRCGSQEYSREC